MKLLVLVGMLFCLGASAGIKDQKMKISVVQYPIQSGLTEDEFFKKMDRYILEAKENRADLVVFPELNAMDVSKSPAGNRQNAELVQIAKDFTPRFFKWIDTRAKQTGMMILGGSAPRFTSEGVVNTAIFAFPTNREPILQDKLNLTPDEKAYHWVNGSKLNVFDTPFGRTVILICYDSQFTSVSTALMGYAPELILVPSWTGEKGYSRVRWASQARAVEHYSYVVIAGTVSAVNATSTEDVGQAAFIPPQDAPFPNLIKEGPYNISALVSAELDFKLLRKARKNAGLYSSRDDLQRSTKMEVIDLTACENSLKSN